MAMDASRLKQNLSETNCRVALDWQTRMLYATDASIHRIEPVAVAFPRNGEETRAVIEATVASDVPLIPRGAGTGLVGGAIGRGLILDFSCHHQSITDLNLEGRTVRVGAGVVLDELNRFLRPHGLAFGPDVATSSRATLGGMIANKLFGSKSASLRDHTRPRRLDRPHPGGRASGHRGARFAGS